MAKNQKSHVDGQDDQRYSYESGDEDQGSAHSEDCENNSDEEGQELKEGNASGLRRSERNKDKPKLDCTFKKFFGFFEAGTEEESLNFSQAMQSDETFECKKSISQFLDDLEQLNAYKVVEKHQGVNIIGSRWFFQQKFDADENLLEFESRMTPFRYQEKNGIDYQKTFAAVAMNGTSRLLFVVAAK